MPKKGHTEEQIIAALKQREGGDKTADILPEARHQPGHVLLVKRQYARLGVQELRELRQLREENGRLKQSEPCSRS